MNTQLRFFSAACLAGLCHLVAVEVTQPDFIRLARNREDFYIGAKSAPQVLDMRLAYISVPLRDELIAEGSILVDSTGMLNRESEKGIYKLKLSSDSVPIVFAEVIRRTGFLRRHNTDGLFIQESQSLRASPELFFNDQWKNAKIKPGDIIVLIEW